MYHKALSIWQELGFKQEIASATYGVGLAHENQGGYTQALDYYYQALALREKLGNPKDFTQTRQRIAEVEARLAAKSEGDNSDDSDDD